MDDIHDILKTFEQYDNIHLPRLVRTLHTMIQGRDFDLDIANAILRLYRFYPSDFDGDTAASILMGALMQMPENDFTLCLGLLHPESLKHERVQSVLRLHELLETCNFEGFWACLKENEDLLEVKLKAPVEYDEYNDEELERLDQGEEVEPRVLTEEMILTCHLTDFRASILEYIAHIVSSTYQTVPKAVIAKMIGNLDADRLNLFIEKQNWTVGENDIVFVRKQEDSIKSKDIVENVHLDSLVDLLATCLK